MAAWVLCSFGCGCPAAGHRAGFAPIKRAGPLRSRPRCSRQSSTEKLAKIVSGAWRKYGGRLRLPHAHRCPRTGPRAAICQTRQRPCIIAAGEHATGIEEWRLILLVPAKVLARAQGAGTQIAEHSCLLQRRTQHCSDGRSRQQIAL